MDTKCLQKYPQKPSPDSFIHVSFVYILLFIEGVWPSTFTYKKCNVLPKKKASNENSLLTEVQI